MLSFYVDDALFLDKWEQNVQNLDSAKIFPFTYLGLSVGDNMSHVRGWQVVIVRL